MFSKQEQRSWIKIECARGHTARQCHQGLQEACGESALPYRTVARWVKAFNEGRQNVADMRRPGPSVSEEEVYALTALLDPWCLSFPQAGYRVPYFLGSKFFVIFRCKSVPWQGFWLAYVGRCRVDSSGAK